MPEDRHTYVCPQCGPDPAGAEIHAETHHTLPSGATDDHEVQREGQSADTRIQAVAEARHEDTFKPPTRCPDPDHGHGCYARASEEGEHRRRNGCPPACNCPPGTHRPATHEEWFVRNPVTLLAETRLDPTALKAEWDRRPVDEHECPCGCGRLMRGEGLHPWHKAPNAPPHRRGSIEHVPPGTPRPQSRWTRQGTWDPSYGDHRAQPPGWAPGDEECAACDVAVLAGAPAIVAKWSEADWASHWWHPGCWYSLQEARRAAAAAGTQIDWPPVRGLRDGKALEQAAREWTDHEDHERP